MWFKVDDQLHGHPKARQAGLAAMGLWAVTGALVGCYGGVGQVPDYYVRSWPQGRKHAAELVKAGLWHGAGHACPDCPQPEDPQGWVFHDWGDFQPEEDEVERKKALDRDRQRKRRRKAIDKERGESVT